MDRPKRAKIFWNGGSQAVRLPKEFRFSTEEVCIRREGDSVILDPPEEPDWSPGFWERLTALGPLSEDFARPEPLSKPLHRDAGIDDIGTSSDA